MFICVILIPILFKKNKISGTTDTEKANDSKTRSSQFRLAPVFPIISAVLSFLFIGKKT